MDNTVLPRTTLSALFCLIPRCVRTRCCAMAMHHLLDAVLCCMQGFKDVMVYHPGAEHEHDDNLTYTTVGTGFVAIPKR